MEFCQNCDNKMNIKWKFSLPEQTEGTKQKILVYYCITCGNTKEYTKNTIINPKLFQQNYEVDKSFITFNNELLCEDPTLQKVTNPNETLLIADSIPLNNSTYFPAPLCTAAASDYGHSLS